MPAASPQLKNHRHPQNITFIFSRCKSLEFETSSKKLEKPRQECTQ